MLEEAYAARNDLGRFLSRHVTADVQKNILTELEWEDVKCLVDLLKPLDQVTRDCSGNDYPTFHFAKPCFHTMQTHLESFKYNFNAIIWIRHVAEKMRDKLVAMEGDGWNQEVVLVGQMLDPYVKIENHESAEKRKEATELLKKYYSFYEADVQPLPAIPAASGSIRSKFLSRMSTTSVATGNEVDRYLGSAIEPECDVLDYWKRNSKNYSGLSRMAVDFFSCCVSSVESERWFSKSGKLVTKERNRLLSDAVQAVMCLKSWHTVLSSCQQVIVLEEE
ncbi:uncharacterized protein LOC129600473 [Paramacrobiotus metropolitanus]|uniref:uncharacterized protein LOC129600473 n=1 Tax=Paramacrobiotus metropolitanus TaxID=2943436 RepID=UPI002445DE7D|nr:uncharacterized protein LOC129600473 [Paramacrobiotus metropolitanus]